MMDNPDVSNIPSEESNGWTEYKGATVKLRSDGDVDCYSTAGYQIVKAKDCDPELLKLLKVEVEEEKTFNIRVRQEAVSYFTVKAVNLREAEKMASILMNDESPCLVEDFEQFNPEEGETK